MKLKVVDVQVANRPMTEPAERGPLWREGGTDGVRPLVRETTVEISWYTFLL